MIINPNIIDQIIKQYEIDNVNDKLYQIYTILCSIDLSTLSDDYKLKIYINNHKILYQLKIEYYDIHTLLSTKMKIKFTYKELEHMKGRKNIFDKLFQINIIMNVI